MIYTKPTFSLSYHGVWSPVQAQAVLEVLQPEAARQGIEFQVFDVSQMMDPSPRLMLRPFCKRHQTPLLGDECKRCKRGR